MDLHLSDWVATSVCVAAVAGLAIIYGFAVSFDVLPWRWRMRTDRREPSPEQRRDKLTDQVSDRPTDQANGGTRPTVGIEGDWQNNRRRLENAPIAQSNEGAAE